MGWYALVGGKLHRSNQRTWLLPQFGVGCIQPDQINRGLMLTTMMGSNLGGMPPLTAVGDNNGLDSVEFNLMGLEVPEVPEVEVAAFDSVDYGKDYYLLRTTYLLACSSVTTSSYSVHGA